MSFINAKMKDILNIDVLIFRHNIYFLGVNCSENSLNCYNLKSRGWDKQMGKQVTKTG